jgi:hypothetical protein
MKTKYLDEFTSREDIEKQFETTLPQDANILIAYYSCANYEGQAYVLYEQGGKLFEVTGGHCSCNGLEGQWEPEETSISALRMIIKDGTKYEVNDVKNDLTEVLDEYEKEKNESN